MRSRALVFGLAAALAAVVFACAPVDVDYAPFDVRDGGKSKALSVPAVVVLADGSANITCQGRPFEIRIMDASNTILGRIPVTTAIPGTNSWLVSFPLFDGLSAYFKPGETYKVDCWGLNGTTGDALSFRVYYTWSQAEADGFTRPE